MKRWALVAGAVLTLAWPAAAGAMLAPPGGGGGGGALVCASGIMGGEGTYSGILPFYYPNTLLQLSVKITDVNVLGFIGTAVVSTTRYSTVSKDIQLLPGQSATFAGPTYTTPTAGVVGVPYSIYLSAESDAVGLAYQVCT